MLGMMLKESNAVTRMGSHRFPKTERDMESTLCGPDEPGTVLIVDDDVTIQMTFSALLWQEGYRIVVANSAASRTIFQPRTQDSFCGQTVVRGAL